jgi:hypothetical protein
MDPQCLDYILVQGAVIHGLLGEQVMGKGIVHGELVVVVCCLWHEGNKKITNTGGGFGPGRLTKIPRPSVE